MIFPNSKPRSLSSPGQFLQTSYRRVWRLWIDSRFPTVHINRHVSYLCLSRAEGVKNSSVTPYLAEFRTRPVMERRAASIHLHVDGEKGPAKADVLSACLQAFYSLLRHVSANQLSHVMSSVVEGLWELNGWDQVVHCCWISQKAVEWSQYQYRFAVPTKLVEYLLETQNDADAASKHLTIVQMVTTVLSSSTPVINLSTSDIISNLCAIMIRKISVNKEDPLLPTLVECIASLGSHVYYSEQIKDLVVRPCRN